MTPTHKAFSKPPNPNQCWVLVRLHGRYASPAERFINCLLPATSRLEREQGLTFLTCFRHRHLESLARFQTSTT
jgi:hypothetical protein